VKEMPTTITKENKRKQLLDRTIVSPWMSSAKYGFWHGVGSVLNLGNFFGEFDLETPWWERDAEAISFDWQKVGRDFEKALGGSEYNF
jgi:hypothetical protein